MKMPSPKRVLLSAFALILSLTCSIDAACPVGDVYPDCTVNLLDLRDFAVKWLDGECLVPGCRANLNGIPGVDMEDFALLAENWLSRGNWTLVINELMADNEGTIEDPDESGEFPDWIEIYNYGDDPIDIGGMYVTDHPDRPLEWSRIPIGYSGRTTIAAGGHLVLWADNDVGQGPLHVNFALGRGGDTIALYDAYRNPIDSIIFGAQGENESYGRLPDANDHWEVFGIGRTTPGKPNRARPVEVLINEIMYHPGHAINTPENIGQEYIELYNKGQEAVNLGGWRFTDGVDFVIPGGALLGSGEYLVVAADVNVFTAKYPGVTNVVGGWAGHLSNSGESVQLVDSAGVIIDRVEYADQGDWAVRQLGPVDFEHRGWEWSDETDGGGKSLELINPAVSNEYGQNWSGSNFDGGTPGGANSAYGGDIAPLILNVRHTPIIPGPTDTVTVTARIMDEAASGIAVTLHYRVDGEATFTAVTMLDNGASGDGDAGDGVYGGAIPAKADKAIVEFYVRANDVGAHSRTWPAASVVDGTPGQVTNALYQVDDSYDANAPWAPGSQPIYYIIMTEAERAELADIGDGGDPFFGEGASDAQMNATFISVDGVDTKVRYRVGIRNRGNRTRVDPPNNYRVNFVNDDPWKDVTALNINSKYPHLQLMGSALFRLAGIPAPEAAAVQLRVNGQNLAAGDYNRMYGSYVALEAYDSDWAANHFPDDDAGNLYRCTYVMLVGGGQTFADLYYKETPGTTPDPDDYRDNYSKQTNSSQDDYSDIFNLIDKLNNTSIPDANFLAEVGRVANLEKWMRYMAADAFAGNREGGLYEGEGDDYAMYRGIEDPRFWLLPHDLDTLLGQGDHSYRPDWEIFSYTNVRGLGRMFGQADAWKAYYGQYKDLAETVFAPAKFNPLVDQLLASWVPASEIGGTNGIKQFIPQRARSILYGGYPLATDGPQIPQQFTVECDLTLVSGFYQTTGSVVAGGAIHGVASAIETRSVLVNDRSASWSQRYGTWVLNQNTTLKPGINRIFVRMFDGPNGTSAELRNEHIDIWYNDGNVSDISGTVAVSRTLDAASGPWHVTGDITVPTGVTLTIQPGTTLFFDAGAGITVTAGGRLVAEGTEYGRIRLTSVPGGAHWDGVKFDHTLSDNRLTYVDHEFGDGQGKSTDVQYSRVTIDHVVWSGTNTEILNVDHPSVICRNSVFPSISSTEPLHGVGLSGAEYLIFDGCIFGTAAGYNDIIDFTGAHRPGPVLQMYNSIFLGGGDDGIDLDSTDAHIEGNVFMNFHGGGGDGTSNAVATGVEGGDPAEIYVARNIFISNDHAVLLKEDCFLYAQNNVFVDTNVAVVSFGEPYRDPPRTPGKGAYMEGNIFWNNAAMFEHFFQEPNPTYGPDEVAVHKSILPVQWHYLGQGNIDADPVFVDEQAGDFHLKAGSGAVGSGAWGLDMGAMVPAGAAISGEPYAVTYRTSATLTVGGPGIVAYKFSLNSPTGPWSAELSVGAPIVLNGLVNGQSYTVYAIGKNSAGVWQSGDSPTASHTWAIDVTNGDLLINEVLAHTHGSDPDIIELYYDGPGPIDLAGMSLSDSPTDPGKFVFSSANVFTTIMNPGDYMVLYGDLNTGVRNHIGFGLLADGEALYLYDKAKPDGSRDLIDGVEFGPQINEFSIGRVGWERSWRLNRMTLGMANIVQALGDPDTLKINEWLANGQVLFDDDFIELYNPHSLPVALDGMYLTDNPITQPGKHRIVPLSFIPPQGYTVFRANDGNEPSEVDFKLSADGEMIGLFDGELNMIDQVLYGPQTTDVSQGRAPNGSASYEFFELPTPGVANTFGSTIVTTSTLVPENSDKRVRVPVSADDVGATWNSDPDFADSGWTLCTGGPGGVGYDRGATDDYGPLITLDVEAQMYNTRYTCYVRIPFTVNSDDLADITGLTLKTRYDDGYVAYINGVIVDRRNFAGTPAWNLGSDSGHEADGDNFDVIVDISDHIGDLRAGKNVLAIHAMNNAGNQSDFVISAEMDVTMTKTDEEYPFFDDLDILAGLRITELMYHSPSGSNFDYVELQNISDKTLNLDGVQFLEGVEFVFPNMELEAGEYVVVASNVAAFRSMYGMGPRVAEGVYTGGLSGSGEDVVLTLAWPLEAAIMRFGYSDRWYPLTDGGGESLHIIDAAAHPATWDDAASWRAAAPTPGAP